ARQRDEQAGADRLGGKETRVPEAAGQLRPLQPEHAFHDTSGPFGPGPQTAAGGAGGRTPPGGGTRTATAAPPPHGPRPITGAIATLRTAKQFKNFWA